MSLLHIGKKLKIDMKTKRKVYKIEKRSKHRHRIEGDKHGIEIFIIHNANEGGVPCSFDIELIGDNISPFSSILIVKKAIEMNFEYFF